MKPVIQKITFSQPSIIPLILRLTFTLVLWPHGAQLLLGWFGGPGYHNAMDLFTSFGLPAFIAFLVIFLQFFASLFILFGAFTRLAAIACIILFLGMIIKVHLQVGFFMDWADSLHAEGFEYHLLAIGILIALLVAGGGKYSIDNLISKQG